MNETRLSGMKIGREGISFTDVTLSTDILNADSYTERRRIKVLRLTDSYKGTGYEIEIPEGSRAEEMLHELVEGGNNG